MSNVKNEKSEIEKAGNWKLRGADKIYLDELKIIIEFVKQHGIHVKNMQLVFTELVEIWFQFLREETSRNAWLILSWESDKLNSRKRRTFQ